MKKYLIFSLLFLAACSNQSNQDTIDYSVYRGSVWPVVQTWGNDIDLDKAIKNTDDVCQVVDKAWLQKWMTYDIFWWEEFNTVVCGYLTNKSINCTEGDLWECVKKPYFAISRFCDTEFEKALQSSINGWNSINKYEDGTYYLNLGCYNQDQIVWDNLTCNVNSACDESKYMDKDTMASILSSNSSQNVCVLLSFVRHPATTCDCCNLPNQIKFIK